MVADTYNISTKINALNEKAVESAQLNEYKKEGVTET